jgi:hypothetical protein
MYWFVFVLVRGGGNGPIKQQRKNATSRGMLAQKMLKPKKWKGA